MKYLLVGVWHGENPNVQTHKTDIRHEPEAAAIALCKHAERTDAPHEIVTIVDDRGPCKRSHLRLGRDYLQADVDDGLKVEQPAPSQDAEQTPVKGVDRG